MRYRTDITIDANNVPLPVVEDIDAALRELGNPTQPTSEWYDHERRALLIEFEFEAADLWEAAEILNGIGEESGVYENVTNVTGTDTKVHIAKPREAT